MRARRKRPPLAVPPTPHIASIAQDDYEAFVGGLSNEQALRKIRQRTTTSGKVVAVAMVAGALGLCGIYIYRSRAYDARMAGIEAAGQLDGAAMLRALRNELRESTYPDVRVRALRNLAHFRDTEALPLFIEALGSPGIVRSAAALGLATLGPDLAEPARMPLMAALAEADEQDRTQVVWALAVLREPAATEAIIEEISAGRLQRQPGFDPQTVALVLGVERLSTSRLTEQATPAVRTLVATALATLAVPEVVPPLLRMLQQPAQDPQVLQAAVAGLGRVGTVEAAHGVLELLEQRPALSSEILAALGRATSATGLAVLLREANGRGPHEALVELLGHTHDPRAADALASVLRDPNERIRMTAASALAELGDARAVDTLLRFATHPNRDMGQQAFDSLLTLGDPRAGKMLLGLWSAYPARRAAIIRALGASDTRAAAPILMRELYGDDVGAAARALGQLGYERAYSTLLRMSTRDPNMDFRRPSVGNELAYRKRYAALTGLGFVSTPLDAAAVQTLRTVIEDERDDRRLRVAAAMTLGRRATDRVYATLLKQLTDPRVPEFTRLAYAQGSWQAPHPASVAVLLPLLQAPGSGQVRRAAALALGYAGSPGLESRLVALLEHPQARGYAALALLLGAGSAETAQAVGQAMGENRDTEEVLRRAMGGGDAHEELTQLTGAMFRSGQIYRRLAIALRLKDDPEVTTYVFPWAHLIERLTEGWDGPDGMTPQAIRRAFFAALCGDAADRRPLAAAALAGMGERGLLLAARDAGVVEAAVQLAALDRPAEPLR